MMHDANDTGRLPDPPVAQTAQTREGYGLTLLAFIVRTGLTCTCSDEQLELALHVSPIASAVYVTTDADKRRQVDHRTEAADAVAQAKRLILLTQKIRREIAQEAAQAAQAPAQAPTPPPLAGGSKVPRTPIQPTQPPAGYALPIARQAPAPRMVPDIQF